jgi:hypothetical protein
VSTSDALAARWVEARLDFVSVIHHHVPVSACDADLRTDGPTVANS